MKKYNKKGGREFKIHLTNLKFYLIRLIRLPVWHSTLFFRQVQLLSTFERGALVQVGKACHRLYDGQ